MVFSYSFPLPFLSLSAVLDPVGSTSKLAFFQAVKKAGGVDAIELFDTVIKSKAFEVGAICLCVSVCVYAYVYMCACVCVV